MIYISNCIEKFGNDWQIHKTCFTVIPIHQKHFLQEEFNVFKKILFTALLFSLTSLTFGSTEESQNALKNGGFEEGIKGWINWGGQVNGQLQYKGLQGAGVYSAEAEWKGMNQIVKIPKNARTFKVEGYMKTDEVVAGKESWEKALISVEFLDETDSALNSYPPNTAEIEGTTGWTKYSRNYSINFLATSVNVILALGNATGSAQFDNISLVFFDESNNPMKISDFKYNNHPLLDKHLSAKNCITDGGFTQNSDSWYIPEGALVNEGEDGSTCIKVGNVSGDYWAVQVINLPQNINKIVVSGKIASENVVLGEEFWESASVSAEFVDSTGRKVGEYPMPIGNISGTNPGKIIPVCIVP